MAGSPWGVGSPSSDTLPAPADAQGSSAPWGSSPSAAVAQPAPSSGGSHSAKDDALKAIKSLASGVGRSPIGQATGQVLDLLSRPGIATQALLSGDGSLHDFARFGHAFVHGETPETQQANRDKIKTAAGIKGLVDALPSGFVRGTADAAIDTALDPTTYLGGAGIIEKGANTLGKAALFAGVKGANNAQKLGIRALASKPGMAATRAVNDGKIIDPADSERALNRLGQIGGGLVDGLTPKGALTRGAISAAPFDLKKPLASISKPFADVSKVATIKNQAVNTDKGIAHAGKAMFQKAIDGLSEADEKTLYDAVDKGTVASLSPEMQARAKQISTSYQAIQHLEGTKTLKKLLGSRGFQLPDEFAPYDTRTRGIFSVANDREHYLPHGPRYSAADRAEAEGAGEPNIEAEDLLGTRQDPKAAAAQSTLNAKDKSKLAREETSHLQGDVARQREIALARFDSAGRAIAAKDASAALAKQFGTKIPIMRKVYGEKPDVGEIYRAAQSGLSAEDKRAVNMLQQGAKPEQVASRVYGDAAAPIPQHLIDRAQSVKDAIAAERSVTHVPTGKDRYDFTGVPQYMRKYFQSDPINKGAGWATLRGIKKLADAPKYGFFGIPFRHMANIGTLGALADPRATALATGRFALAHPEATGAVGGAIGGYTQGGVPGALAGAAVGALGGRGLKMTGAPARAAASQGRVVDAATKAGAIAFNPEEGVPHLIKSIPGVGKAYGASSRFLWDYDEAVKAARYDSLIKRGVEPAQAAQRVGEDLLDYGNKSKLTKAAGHFAPFATYRTKLPGAVARAIARNPERALIANRMAPALAGQDQKTTDGGMVRSYLPLAEVLRGYAKPEEYMRSTLSAPYKDLAAGLNLGDLGVGETLRGEKRKDGHWMLGYNPKTHKYNRVGDVLLSQLIGPFPGGDEALSAIHQNPYDARGLPTDLLQGSTGLNYFPAR